MNIAINKLEATELGDFIELINLFEEVFEMKDFKIPSNTHLERLLSHDSFFVFVAKIDNVVVGGLTAYLLKQYYSEKHMVYIYDLAVKTELQRKGIGKALVASINGYCKEIGIQEVFVQADEIDDYALDFYRSTGATEEKVRHYYYPLN